MMILCGFMCYNALKEDFKFIALAILSGGCAILSIIILVCYFRQIRIAKYLLSVYICLLLVLFISSAAAETISFGFKLFPFVMKATLYGFFCAISIKHFFILKEKLALLDKYN